MYIPISLAGMNRRVACWLLMQFLFVALGWGMCTINTAAATSNNSSPCPPPCCKRTEAGERLWGCFFVYPKCRITVVVTAVCRDDETGGQLPVEMYRKSMWCFASAPTCVDIGRFLRLEGGCSYPDPDPCGQFGGGGPCPYGAAEAFVEAACNQIQSERCRCYYNIEIENYTTTGRRYGA
jgi:hypothetical protein